jgi:hypothetical protein
MKPKEESGIAIHIHGPNNGVLNVAGNDQKDLQTNHITQQNNPQYIEQLHQLLTKVLQEADKQNEISKTQFAELSKIVDQIQTELQKKQSADSGILSKAKTTLEAFKNIASIAGSINAIIALLP